MTTRILMIVFAVMLTSCGPKKKTPDELEKNSNPTYVQGGGGGGDGDPGDRNRRVAPDPLVGVYRQVNNPTVFLEITPIHKIFTGLKLPIKEQGSSVNLTPSLPSPLRFDSNQQLYVTEGFVLRASGAQDMLKLKAHSFDDGKMLDVFITVKVYPTDTIQALVGRLVPSADRSQFWVTTTETWVGNCTPCQPCYPEPCYPEPCYPQPCYPGPCYPEPCPQPQPQPCPKPCPDPCDPDQCPKPCDPDVEDCQKPCDPDCQPNCDPDDPDCKHCKPCPDSCRTCECNCNCNCDGGGTDPDEEKTFIFQFEKLIEEEPNPNDPNQEPRDPNADPDVY